MSLPLLQNFRYLYELSMQLISCYGSSVFYFEPWEDNVINRNNPVAISQLRLMKFHQKPFGLGLCNESFDARWLFVFGGWHKALGSNFATSVPPHCEISLFDPNRIHQRVPAAIPGSAHLSDQEEEIMETTSRFWFVQKFSTILEKLRKNSTTIFLTTIGPVFQSY